MGTVINERVVQRMSHPEDLDAVRDWLGTDQLRFELDHENILKFEPQIQEMVHSLPNFPQDEKRVQHIRDLIRNGEPLFAVFVRQGDPHNWILEGRHRATAFYLEGESYIPTIRVSPKDS